MPLTYIFYILYVLDKYIPTLRMQRACSSPVPFPSKKNMSVADAADLQYVARPWRLPARGQSWSHEESKVPSRVVNRDVHQVFREAVKWSSSSAALQTANLNNFVLTKQNKSKVDRLPTHVCVDSTWVQEVFKYSI